MLNRKISPEAAGNISFQLPDIRKTKLNNGLDLLFVGKNNLPIVQVNLVISAGSKYESPDKKGTAYLTSALIDEGAGKFSALELDDEIEKLGSVLSTSIDHDTILISMMTLKENLERSLELLTMVITEPLFTETDFEREKKKLLTKIIQLKDEPSYIANTSAEKIIFNGSPYAMPTIGYEETVNALTNNDIKNFYKEYFTVDNSAMVVVGNLSEEELSVLLNKHFSVWNNKRKIEEPHIFTRKEKTKVYVIHRDGSAQSEIRIAHLSAGRDTEDYFAKSIMNSILGGQFSSRINLNLREDKGYTYGANSSFSYQKGTASFTVSTAVQNENTGNAVKEIFKELENIKQGIDISELDFAKSYLVKSFPLMFETYSQVARNLAHLIIHSLPIEYFNDYIDNLEKQSLEDVENAAKDNIDTEHLCILAVGDKNVIIPQLEEVVNIKPVELDTNGNVI